MRPPRTTNLHRRLVERVTDAVHNWSTAGAPLPGQCTTAASSLQQGRSSLPAPKSAPEMIGPWLLACICIHHIQDRARSSGAASETNRHLELARCTALKRTCSSQNCRNCGLISRLMSGMQSVHTRMACATLSMALCRCHGCQRTVTIPKVCQKA